MSGEGQWVVASDLAARLRDLRKALREKQGAMAVRWGRGRKQVSAWENGRQLPHRSAIERAAKTNGWPLTIFAEGGPMPATVVNRPFTARSDTPPRVVRERGTPPYGAAGGDALDFMRDLALKAIREHELAGEPILYSEATGWVERMYSAGRAAQRPPIAAGGSGEEQTG